MSVVCHPKTLRKCCSICLTVPWMSWAAPTLSRCKKEFVALLFFLSFVSIFALHVVLFARFGSQYCWGPDPLCKVWITVLLRPWPSLQWWWPGRQAVPAEEIVFFTRLSHDPSSRRFFFFLSKNRPATFFAPRYFALPQVPVSYNQYLWLCVLVHEYP